MNNRLDFFIESLLKHARTTDSLEHVILLARQDLMIEDHRQEEIEAQTLDDIHYADRYGKGE